MVEVILISIIIALALLPHLGASTPMADDVAPAPSPAATIGDAIAAVEADLAAHASAVAVAAAANADLASRGAVLAASTAALSDGLKKIGGPVLGPGATVTIYEYDDAAGYKKLVPLPPSTPIPA